MPDRLHADLLRHRARGEVSDGDGERPLIELRNLRQHQHALGRAIL